MNTRKNNFCSCVKTKLSAKQSFFRNLFKSLNTLILAAILATLPQQVGTTKTNNNNDDDKNKMIMINSIVTTKTTIII